MPTYTMPPVSDPPMPPSIGVDPSLIEREQRRPTIQPPGEAIREEWQELLDSLDRLGDPEAKFAEKKFGLKAIELGLQPLGLIGGELATILFGVRPTGGVGGSDVLTDAELEALRHRLQQIPGAGQVPAGQVPAVPQIVPVWQADP